jgi:hypothetical protein
VSGKAGIGLWGSKIEASGQAGLENGFDIWEETAPGDERMLLDVEAHFAAVGQLQLLRSPSAIAEIYASGRSEFVTGVLPFRWVSTHSVNPVDDAKAKESVEFELNRDATDYGGMLAVPVRMSGSLKKCVSRKQLHDGSTSPTSHLAVFLRSLAHHTLPLGFFAHFQSLPKLIYLKPYAIWFP